MSNACETHYVLLYIARTHAGHALANVIHVNVFHPKLVQTDAPVKLNTRIDQSIPHPFYANLTFLHQVTSSSRLSNRDTMITLLDMAVSKANLVRSFSKSRCVVWRRLFENYAGTVPSMTL